MTASALVAARLDPRPDRVVVRGSSRSLPPGRSVNCSGCRCLAELPNDPASCRHGGLRPTELRRRTRRLVDAVLVGWLTPVCAAGWSTGAA